MSDSLVEYDNDGNAYYAFDLPEDVESVFPVGTDEDVMLAYVAKILNFAHYHQRKLMDPGNYVIKVINDKSDIEDRSWEIRNVTDWVKENL